MGIINRIAESYVSLISTSLNEFFIRVLIATALIIAGIFLGNLIAYSLKYITRKVEFEKYIRKSFINLFVTVIKWSVYLIFINIALIELAIPALTKTLTDVLLIIPTFVSALILISIGFGIGTYLKKIIQESGIKEGDILAPYIFYFCLLVSGIYALKVAFLTLNSAFANNLILVISATTILAFGYAYGKTARKN